MSLVPGYWSLNRLAVELKMSARALGRRLADLPPAKETKHGDKVSRQWRLSDVVRHLNGRPTNGEAMHAVTPGEAKARYMEARARKAEFEVGKLERTLLSAAAVTETWSRLVAAFRNRCLLIPTKVAPELEHKNIIQIHEVLTREIHECLTEISNFRLEDIRDAQ